MTLKEKFIDAFKSGKRFDIQNAETIADEFSVDFGCWIVDNTLRVDLDSYKTFGDSSETKPHTMKELLEIFKKEKGLLH